jgi:hypothetical protein
MTVADLNGADFVGYDAPPAIVARPGETITVPVFVSHYSDRTEAPVLAWWVYGYNEIAGEDFPSKPRSQPVVWAPYKVTGQPAITFRAPDEPFVGALVLALMEPDEDLGIRTGPPESKKPGEPLPVGLANWYRFTRKRPIAANFVNIAVQPDRPRPRIQRHGFAEGMAVLRFAPADFARARWSGPKATPAGKAHGQGTGWFEYRLKLPPAVTAARPTSLLLMLEASARAGREKVDWPQRVNAQDYPQTDVRKWPTTLEITVNGEPIIPENRMTLADDPADARGVLSHLRGVEHGSHGARVAIGGPLPESVRAELAAGRPLVLRLAVPEDAEHPGGLAIYGATTGGFPTDPTVLLGCDNPLPADLREEPGQPLAVDVAAERTVPVLRSGDTGRDAPSEWLFTTTDPGDGWNAPDFDARGWKRGPGGFGTPGTPALRERTVWDTPAIWLRTTVELPELAPDDTLTLHYFHDEDMDIFVNGQRLLRRRGHVTSYRDEPLSADQKALFRPGANTIAVHCRQTGGGQGIDVGLLLWKDEAEAAR